MAGMFYSLQEAAEKLNKTEEQIKALVKQGKLREFRDGPNLLFKIDEIEALTVDEGAPIKIEDLEQPTEPEGVTKSAETTEPQQPIEIEQPTEPVGEIEPEKAPEAEKAPKTQEVPAEEILLAPETGISAAESGLTEADTALTGEGISVLGETDKDYKLTEDTMAETIGAAETKGASGVAGTAPGASLEEIEEDVNLDTFGSGSGLLDLSLQADDTSLGGILDEIYTTEGGEGQEEPAEPGSAVEMVAEAEQMLPEEELTAPQPAPVAPAIVQPYIEPTPDVQSNIFGKLLILPSLALLYTAIVAVAGQRGVVPSILAAIQNAIWYIVIGAIVAAGLVVGAAFWLSGDLSKSPKKPPKPKKAKKAKKASPATL